MLAFLLLAASAALAAPPAEVRLSWTYEGLPAGMRVFEAPADPPALWTTSTAERLEDVPHGEEVAGGKVRLAPGSGRLLVLAYRNPGPSPLRFFAAPHDAKPRPAALGMEFECLCLNHVYAVGPGRWWWRVVRLSLDAEYDAPRLDVTHALVRVTKDSVKGRPLSER